MNALDLIRRVEALGGKLALEGDELRVRAAEPLPEGLVAELSSEKPSIMVALGAPLDAVAARVLTDLRPHLPETLRGLPDDRLLALVNWSIMAAWDRAVRELGKDISG